MSEIEKIHKRLFVLILPLFLSCFARAQKENWQNLDLAKDNIFGVSTELAYKQLRSMKPRPVIVAVIDNGFDINHQDLLGSFWVNRNEKPGNKLDDDGNGYIDDIHGWNFLGSGSENVQYDNAELTRIVRRDSIKYSRFDSLSMPAIDSLHYKVYLKNKKILEDKYADARNRLISLTAFREHFEIAVQRTGKEKPDTSDFRKLSVDSVISERFKEIAISGIREQSGFDNFHRFMMELVKRSYIEANYHYNIKYDPRFIIGDDYVNAKDRLYGNSDIKGQDAGHGTHIAGIIAANRLNQIGIKGVANHARIMAIRAIPDGDERDKDIASAIIYAVNNGAKIINMSFGKYYSWDKAAVDDAVQYAMNNDVLIIHAAGNENKNIDTIPHFPYCVYQNGNGKAEAWIEVGATGWQDTDRLKAPFSNYGQTTVDVFAPGVLINSTIADSRYGSQSGTSMAAPVVAGVAALIRSYYPKLTAMQVKDIILKSVTKVTQSVVVGSPGNETLIAFSQLCVSGGVVNAYEALKLAGTYK